MITRTVVRTLRGDGEDQASEGLVDTANIDLYIVHDVVIL